MYSRKDYLESTDCAKQCLALNNEGLDWNYAIAPVIDRDLHERLLEVPATDVLQFGQLLPLICSGYFGTALEILHTIEVTNTPEVTNTKLLEIKEWLISALNEAREV